MGSYLLNFLLIAICVCDMVVTTSKKILHEFLVKYACELINVYGVAVSDVTPA